MGHVACSIDGCGAGVLALGLCRKHYDRQRKNGDPLLIGRAGPRPNPHVAAMNAAGVSEDQRSRWAAAGLLGVEQDPVTGRWEWTAEAARRAILLRAMTAAGITLPAARALLGEGLELRPGLWLRVSQDAQ